jgi:hypothetical protein
VHTYDYDPDADSIGLQAAEALGEPPQRVLKTLMALVDGKPVCTVARCWSRGSEVAGPGTLTAAGRQRLDRKFFGSLLHVSIG